MKKLLFSTVLLAAFGTAQAIPVLNYSIDEGPSGPATGTSFLFSYAALNTAVGTSVFSSNQSGYKGGSLQVDVVPASLTFTYLGKEAGHSNQFTYDLAGANEHSFWTASTSKGTQFWVSVNEEGYLELTFKDLTNALTASSGYDGSNPNNSKFGFLGVQGVDFKGKGDFDYLITFNDNYADADYNDMVVGVKAVQAIPEPETYALMLAGLGVVGFMARRRRQV